MPEFFKTLGYRTHFVGVWNLGFYKKRFTPTNRGFDSSFSKWTGSGDYWTHVATDDIETKMQGFDLRLNEDLMWNQSGLYSTRLFTERAVNLIREHDETKPLFLVLSHQALHTANYRGSLQCPLEHLDTFGYIGDRKRRLFAGALTEVDHSLGQMFEALHNRGLLKNTILVFASASGGMSVGGFTNNRSFNFPLRGTKGTYFEGGIRVPAFVWSPLLNKTRRVSNQLMHVTDWLPTLLSAAGGDSKMLGIVFNLDSINMWEALSGGLKSPRTEIIHDIDLAANTFALQMGSYKGIAVRKSLDAALQPSGWYLIRGDRPGFRSWETDHGNVLKVMRRLYGKNWEPPHPEKNGSVVTCPVVANATACFLSEGTCLFDLDKDPCEQNNIAASHPEIVARLTEKLRSSTSYVPWVKDWTADKDCDPATFNGAWVSWRDPFFNRYAVNRLKKKKHFA